MKKRIWKKKVKAALAAGTTCRFEIPVRSSFPFSVVTAKGRLWLVAAWPLHLATLLERGNDVNALLRGAACLLWERMYAPRAAVDTVLEGKA